MYVLILQPLHFHTANMIDDVALGLMPLQLVNIGPILSLGYTRALYAITPRGTNVFLNLPYSGRIRMLLTGSRPRRS
jgi:hypothetical protein